MQRRNNNVRKQSKKKRTGSRLGETVRIASLVQKGIRTGRSNNVEMQVLARLTKHNIKTRIQAVLRLLESDKSFASNKLLAGQSDHNAAELLAKIPSHVSEGYTDLITPNGIFQRESLDRLISADAEITTVLSMLESQLKTKSPHAIDAIASLAEILKERKEFVQSLKA